MKLCTVVIFIAGVWIADANPGWAYPSELGINRAYGPRYGPNILSGPDNLGLVGLTGDLGLAGLEGLDSIKANPAQPMNVKKLKPILVPSKKTRIIEHRGSEILIKPQITRFALKSPDVLVSPVLVSNTPSVNVRPRVITGPTPNRVVAPVVARMVSNIVHQSQNVIDSAPHTIGCDCQRCQLPNYGLNY